MKPITRPHLTIEGKLCDEDQPCAHARYDLETERLGRIVGSIVGAFVGISAAATCFTMELRVAGLLLLGGTAAASLVMGLLLRFERRN